MNHKRPIQLPGLLKRDRNAVTVYFSLRWMAGGSRQLNTTRQRIADVCGLSPKRITAAMTALHEAGWLIRRYGRNGKRAWYRLVLRGFGLFPEGRKTTFRDPRP